MVKYNYVKEFIEKPIKTFWELNSLSDFKGETFTYADVARKIYYLHRLYEIWGIKQGDKISLVGRNNAEWGIVYLSVISYGAVIVPILPDFRLQRYIYCKPFRLATSICRRHGMGWVESSRNAQPESNI